MLVECDRNEQVWNSRGRCLEKGACSRGIELCSSTSRVSRLNQTYCFLLVFSILPRDPKKFLPSSEVYISISNISNHGNLHCCKIACIGKRLLAVRLYVVTNAAKEIKFPTSIDLRVDKAIIPRIIKRL